MATDDLKADLEYIVPNQDGMFGDREVIYGNVAERALARIAELEAQLAAAKSGLLKVASNYRGNPHLKRADATEALAAIASGAYKDETT